ncbi:MAG: MCE family protein [Deltaproteobacteria bacterium]|nr:MCE family protein [Deltaproteobacteria bacterium]
MASQASKLKVGIFVTAGILLALGALVWLGAAQYMKGATTYVTFFDESVQGLQIDSPVKFRGVDVGRVIAIRVAPDYRLIEVVMNIEFQGNLTYEMTAQLKSVGITGITFIELDRHTPGTPLTGPKIDFAAEYPIIPSRPSEMQRILSVIDRVMRQLDQVDFKGMARAVDTTLKAVEKLVGDPRLAKAMEKLGSTLANTEVITQRIRVAMEDGGLKQTLVSARGAAAKAEELATAAADQMEALNLPETNRKLNQVLADLDQLVQNSGQTVDTLGDKALRLAESLNQTAQRLNQAAEKVEGFASRIESNPSSLLFSEPPPPSDEVQIDED